MLLALFLFTPALAVAPTETFYDQSSITVLVARKAPTSPKIAPYRTFVREPSSALKSEYAGLVSQISGEYGVSGSQMEATINCETAGTWNPTMQSTYPNQKDGGRELSFGLAQIHLPDHPTISRAQATDPEFSIRFMAQEFKAGRQSEWTCWRNLVKGKY